MWLGLFLFCFVFVCLFYIQAKIKKKLKKNTSQEAERLKMRRQVREEHEKALAEAESAGREMLRTAVDAQRRESRIRADTHARELARVRGELEARCDELEAALASERDGLEAAATERDELALRCEQLSVQLDQALESRAHIAGAEAVRVDALSSEVAELREARGSAYEEMKRTSRENAELAAELEAAMGEIEALRAQLVRREDHGFDDSDNDDNDDDDDDEGDRWGTRGAKRGPTDSRGGRRGASKSKSMSKSASARGPSSAKVDRILADSRRNEAAVLQLRTEVDTWRAGLEAVRSEREAIIAARDDARRERDAARDEAERLRAEVDALRAELQHNNNSDHNNNDNNNDGGDYDDYNGGPSSSAMDSGAATADRAWLRDSLLGRTGTRYNNRSRQSMAMTAPTPARLPPAPASFSLGASTPRRYDTLHLLSSTTNAGERGGTPSPRRLPPFPSSSRRHASSHHNDSSSHASLAGSSPPPAAPRCAVCSSRASTQLVCRDCKSVHYCTMACRDKHAAAHRLLCGL
jgi:hypothetical protein